MKYVRKLKTKNELLRSGFDMDDDANFFSEKLNLKISYATVHKNGGEYVEVKADGVTLNDDIRKDKLHDDCFVGSVIQKKEEAGNSSAEQTLNEIHKLVTKYFKEK